MFLKECIYNIWPFLNACEMFYQSIRLLFAVLRNVYGFANIIDSECNARLFDVCLLFWLFGHNQYHLRCLLLVYRTEITVLGRCLTICAHISLQTHFNFFSRKWGKREKFDKLQLHIIQMKQRAKLAA